MDMVFRRKMNRRPGRTGLWQKAVLRFFVGFLIGALFYYIFQKSFSGLFQDLEKNMSSWEMRGHSFVSGFLRSLWNHGKYFGLFWIMVRNRKIYKTYEILFTIYTGLRNGFLLLFFLMERGMRGILLYLASLFPHILLFAPLYVFCFYWANESRQRERKLSAYLAIAVVFLAACALEVKCNLPLMEKIM